MLPKDLVCSILSFNSFKTILQRVHKELERYSCCRIQYTYSPNVPWWSLLLNYDYIGAWSINFNHSHEGAERMLVRDKIVPTPAYSYTRQGYMYLTKWYKCKHNVYGGVRKEITDLLKSEKIRSYIKSEFCLKSLKDIKVARYE